MSKSMIDELAKVLVSTTRLPKAAPGPGPGRSVACKAIKRCCSAWQRAFNAAMKNPENDFNRESNAEEAANNAYCTAMPVLAGYEGIRDFIACAAHGILLGAISEQKSGQLLYAAQVAITSLSREPRPQKKQPK